MHTHPLRIALGQYNFSVGDIFANRDRVIDGIGRAKAAGATIVAFPELALTGYPPEDLLFKPRFIDANLRALDAIVGSTEGITAVVGFVDRQADIYNAAAIISNGEIADIYHKQFLPNYGVFDEERYFQSGANSSVFRIDDVTLGVNICEDIWYPGGPAREQALRGDADLIVNISSSPFHDGKGLLRDQMVATRAADHGVALAFCNLVGGQDELAFDGGSLVVDQSGAIVAQASRFDEQLLIADVDIESVFRHRLHDPRRRKEKTTAGPAIPPVILSSPTSAPSSDVRSDNLPVPTPPSYKPEERLADVYRALVVGTRDYVRKNGFEKVLVGLSGGVDSALVAAIAFDALGRDSVGLVTMPSRFSSDGTKSDAQTMAEGIGIDLLTLPIQGIFETYLAELSDEFDGKPFDIAEENIQPRIRGNLLMALCNKFGWLVLTTGNKSEMSMGYATLYGDMAGGYAVIKDIYKTLVYELCEYRNGLSDGPIIPESIIERPPTAELRKNQFDTDSLPPYDVLDPILEAYVEKDKSLQEIVQLGFDEKLVTRVIRSVDLNEYKRRQSPPGVKITPRAFGRDRRLPITNRCREY
ncbi:TPA: NAD+ synthase [Candidatus Latescibacteria bacterium]|nr:NAD+ synthase [Candidatus Latescibacterota bacterium]